MTGREIIVVFGAANRPDGTPSPALVRRVDVALSWGRDRGALFLVTGGIVTAPPAEAQIMAGMLRTAGIPETRIVIEDRARTTLESVRRCKSILTGLQPSRIVICTDDFHLARCQWLMKRAGFDTEGLAARSERRRLWPRLREALALPVDTLCWTLGL